MSKSLASDGMNGDIFGHCGTMNMNGKTRKQRSMSFLGVSQACLLCQTMASFRSHVPLRMNLGVNFMREEKALKEATVCYLVRGREVLLGMKTDKIGKDCWNGYGGGVESGETISEAASRELEEELGVIAKPQHLEKVAVMTFHNIKSDG